MGDLRRPICVPLVIVTDPNVVSITKYRMIIGLLGTKTIVQVIKSFLAIRSLRYQNVCNFVISREPVVPTIALPCRRVRYGSKCSEQKLVSDCEFSVFWS